MRDSGLPEWLRCGKEDCECAEYGECGVEGEEEGEEGE